MNTIFCNIIVSVLLFIFRLTITTRGKFGAPYDPRTHSSPRRPQHGVPSTTNASHHQLRLGRRYLFLVVLICPSLSGSTRHPPVLVGSGPRGGCFGGSTWRRQSSRRRRHGVAVDGCGGGDDGRRPRTDADPRWRPDPAPRRVTTPPYGNSRSGCVAVPVAVVPATWWNTSCCGWYCFGSDGCRFAAS